MSFFQTITLVDVLDVVVLATLIYQVMLIFRRTRASQLIMGIFYFALLFLIAFLLGMTATTWVFERLVGLFAIALLIIFQPELRSFFERAGRRGFLLAPTRGGDIEDIEKLLDTIVQALEEMGEEHTGAIIVLEREIGLTEYINTGERIDAQIRKDLLKTIFHKGNPLHDGAVIIRGGRIISARSFLPLSDSRDIPSHLGTRHRAALGVTEHSDAVSLVASEETGHLSLFHGGKPAFRLTPNTLRHMVKGILMPDIERERPYTQFRLGLERYFRFGQKRASGGDTTPSDTPDENEWDPSSEDEDDNDAGSAESEIGEVAVGEERGSEKAGAVRAPVTTGEEGDEP